MSDALESTTKQYRLEKVWKIWVELGPQDYTTVYQAVLTASSLDYGAYDQVAFQSAAGQQYFRGCEGSIMSHQEPTSEAVQILTFSIPCIEETLGAVIKAIQSTHSYQEPVIYVSECYSTRMNYRLDGDNPNRWWLYSDEAKSA